jgi:hypothetical protein
MMSAYAEFYVIPVVKNIKNVITVAKSGGKFTDPVAALASINDANASNPYVVYIGPGIYTLTQTLKMKSYVHIVGSGMEATKLVGNAVSHPTFATNALVEGWSYSSMRELSIELSGTGVSATAIYNSQIVSATFHRIHVAVSGAEYSKGIYNYLGNTIISQSFIEIGSCNEESKGVYNNGGTLIISDSEIVIDNLGNTIGIHNKNSTATIKSTAITINGVANNRYGVYNEASSVEMRLMQIEVTGGTNTAGIYGITSGAPVIDRCNVKVGGGDTTNYGVRNDKVQTSVHHSSISASGTGAKVVLSENSGAMRATQSVLQGGGITGNNLCAFCSDAIAGLLDDNCAP